MRQRIEPEAARRAVLGLQLDLDGGAETVLALPELLEPLPHCRGLVDTEPEKGFAPQRDDRLAVPAFDQQLAHQWMEAALDLHRPGLVADGLVRQGVDPGEALAQLTSCLEVGHRLAVQVAIEHLAHDLPTTADEGFAMANLLAPPDRGRRRQSAHRRRPDR